MLIICIVVLLSIIVYYAISRGRQFITASRIQGPKSWPIIGYTRFLTSSQRELFEALLDLQKQYGELYKVWLFMDLWVITCDPTVAEKVLNDQRIVKSTDYELLKPWLGTGLLTSEGRKWFSRRKSLTPAFHFKILEDFVSIFQKHTDILIEKFRMNCITDVSIYLPLFTLDNICETALGIQINALNDRQSTYVQAIQNILDISYKRMFNPLLGYELVFNFTNMSKVYNESLQVVKNRTQTVIERRREYLIDRINDYSGMETKDDEGIKKKMTFIDILLQSTIDGQCLTDADIQEEVNTFMFAGQDTTATACGFLLYNIAKYPNVQEKLVDEISSTIGIDKHVQISMKDLNDLPYLDLVLKESLRYHTTVPLIGRQILKETQIGKYCLPENTNLSINVYGMCHNEKLFSNPDKFSPERFDLMGDNEKINTFAFIPFSAGPRNCIGQKFALLEMKMMAARVLQHFEISLASPTDELVFNLGITLKPVNGICLIFKERHQ